MFLVQLVNTLGGSDWEWGRKGQECDSKEASDALLLGLGGLWTVKIMRQQFFCPSD